MILKKEINYPHRTVERFRSQKECIKYTHMTKRDLNKAISDGTIKHGFLWEEHIKNTYRSKKQQKEIRVCSQCGEGKEYSSSYWDMKIKQGGLSNVCLACQRRNLRSYL